MPKVSVVIPTYNRANFLAEAIESVLQQTFTDFEIIVVDDGSTDNTPEIIKKSFGGLVRYIRLAHSGASRARNVGISLANGDYIAFLDADDCWLPHKLAMQVPLLDQHPEVGLIYSAYYVMDEAGRTLYLQRLRQPRRTLQELLENPMGATPTVLVRRSCFAEVGVFDESLWAAEDWDMWLRIAQRYELRGIAQPLAKCRLSTGSLVRKNPERVKEQTLRVLDKWFGEPGLLTEMSSWRREELRRRAYSAVYLSIALNFSRNPLPYLLTALRFDPLLPIHRWRPFGLLILRPLLGENRLRRLDDLLERLNSRIK